MTHKLKKFPRCARPFLKKSNDLQKKNEFACCLWVSHGRSHDTGRGGRFFATLTPWSKSDSIENAKRKTFWNIERKSAKRIESLYRFNVARFPEGSAFSECGLLSSRKHKGKLGEEIRVVLSYVSLWVALMHACFAIMLTSTYYYIISDYHMMYATSFKWEEISNWWARSRLYRGLWSRLGKCRDFLTFQKISI